MQCLRKLHSGLSLCTVSEALCFATIGPWGQGLSLSPPPPPVIS